jgi:hypothetical protein
MLIQGFPITVSLASDPSFKDRFWYWSGASGRKYIHSVYRVAECPPLPGASYVAVERKGNLRIALQVGRFQPFWDHDIGNGQRQRLAALGADEVHVHLLGKSPAETEAVHGDLLEAFEDSGMLARTAALFNRAPEAVSAGLQ